MDLSKKSKLHPPKAATTITSNIFTPQLLYPHLRPHLQNQLPTLQNHPQMFPQDLSIPKSTTNSTSNPALVGSSTHDLYESQDLKERKHICLTCNKGFKRKDHLNRHQLTHLNSEEKPNYKCEKCPKSYSTPHKLKDHIPSHLQPPNQ